MTFQSFEIINMLQIKLKTMHPLTIKMLRDVGL